MRQAGEDFRSRFAVALLDPLKSADSRQAGGSAAAPLQIWLGAWSVRARRRGVRSSPSKTQCLVKGRSGGKLVRRP
jgi:hypothetical protein